MLQKKRTADRSFHGASRYRAVLEATSIRLLYSCVRTPSLASLFLCTPIKSSRHTLGGCQGGTQRITDEHVLCY